MRWWLLILPPLLFSTATIAAPPPPPPPGIEDIAAKITNTFKPDTFNEYSSLFSNDVKVYKNDKMLAKNKAEWLDMARKMVSIWHLKNLDIAPSWKGVLITETVNNMPPYQPGLIVDCCFWARSALYSFDDAGKINEVRFLESGGYWGTPQNPH